jgi:polyphosphate kinase
MNIENRKIAFVLEGRDASGKGGFLKFLIKKDIPHLVYHQGMPTKTRAKHWLSDYERVLPKKGQLIIFDRSWHTRSWVQPALGYCSKRQYENHIKKVKAWELKQEAKGIEIVKNWISINKSEQERLIARRKEFKPYKWSETDALGVTHFDRITHFKERMFLECPKWNIVDKAHANQELLAILTNTIEGK